jgi:hypothetical protein
MHTQNNINSDLVSDKPNAMVDTKDSPSLDDWTARPTNNYWVRGDEVE